MTRLPVWIDSARGAAYAVAVAELPARASIATVPAGAIAVVSTASAMDAAVRAGAAAVVLSDPGVIDEQPLPLSGSTGRPVPVVVDRRGLRADAVAWATARHPAGQTRFITAELVAPAAERDDALLAALGWARELNGGAFDVVASSGNAARSMALLVARDSGAALVVTLNRAPTQDRGIQLRVTSVAEERREVVIDAGILRVSRSTLAGDEIAPQLFESRERSALRRALDALRDGVQPPDLASLQTDSATLRDIAAARAEA